MRHHRPRDAAPADASSSRWRPRGRRQEPSSSTASVSDLVAGTASLLTQPSASFSASMGEQGSMAAAGVGGEGGASSPSPTAMLSSSGDSTSVHFQTSASNETMSSSMLSASQNLSSTVYTTPTATASPSKSKWTYKPTASTTTSGYGAAATTYVPGIIFNMTMSLPSDEEAVYTVPMVFGHDTSGGSDYKRAPSNSTQVLNMLVDLGSSDMWVASKYCKTSVCKSAPALFDPELSEDSGVPQRLSYHSGSVEGDIYWEQVTLGNFGIGYQAMVVGDTIYNENLGPGKFSGLLGLSLPANSLITQSIPGTTGSDADGATFLDNLFGAGASAPTQRYFSLSLQRPEDERTYSTFGIGDVFKPLCPDSSKLTHVPIVANPQFGRTGFLHWRVQIDGIKYTTFADAQAGTEPTTASISLGRSETSANTTTPLAVLDSGGLAILVSNKTLIDSIYGAFGVHASADGVYRMPCTTPITLALTIGGQDFPIHPLDLTWPEQDPSSSNCVGALQYTPSVGKTGDLILGSSFLKNVYSVYHYPDQSKSPSTWRPTVGLLSLTDPAAASREFYAVRTQRKSLQVVSSDSNGVNGNSGGAALQEAAQHKAVNVAVIAACSVVGFLVLVGVAFCAWWFWLRRRADRSGTDHQQEYKLAAIDPSDTSTDTSRSRKHQETKRQRSMVDGYSDYEVESWRSGRTDSIGLTGVPEAHNEDDPKANSTWTGNALPNHSRGNSLHQGLLSTSTNSSPESMNEALPDTFPRTPEAAGRWPEHRGSLAPELLDRRTSRSRSRTSTRTSIPQDQLIDLAPTTPPATHIQRPAHSTTLSMSGPFPSQTPMSRSEFGYFEPH